LNESGRFSDDLNGINQLAAQLPVLAFKILDRFGILVCVLSLIYGTELLQTAVGDAEFGNANSLRSEVNSDQAGWSGHGARGLNRNSKMPKQNFCSEIQPDGMRCPQRVGYTCTLSPDFLRLRRTEHVVFNAFADCRLICLYPPISKKDRREFSVSFRSNFRTPRRL
jgi:hypothetical protein